jgi:hypothetical protein
MLMNASAAEAGGSEGRRSIDSSCSSKKSKTAEAASAREGINAEKGKEVIN